MYSNMLNARGARENFWLYFPCKSLQPPKIKLGSYAYASLSSSKLPTDSVINDGRCHVATSICRLALNCRHRLKLPNYAPPPPPPTGYGMTPP